MSLCRALAVGVALLLLPSVVYGAAPAVTGKVLDNGLTVVVRENRVAPVVAMALLVHMGSRWETAEHAGISNFVHAVMVKGTRRRSGGALAEALATMGAKLTAQGDVDASSIQAQGLARFWRELLALVAEVALEPALAPEEVATERAWLLARIQQRRDNPLTRAFDELYAILYGPHPYGLPVLGTPASLARIDPGALRGAWQAAYRPERLVLAVSGAVRAAEVVAEAAKLFGHLPRGGPVTAPALPPPAPTAPRRVLEHPGQQAHVLVGSLAPPLHHPDHAPVRVLAALLGGGMASRLFAELRDRQGLAYTASASYEPTREPGALVLHLATAPHQADRAEAGLLAEVARVRNAPVSGEELARAKGYLLGREVLERRTNARQAWHLAFAEIQGVGQAFTLAHRRAVEAVGVDDVQRVAATYLTAPVVLVLRPPESARGARVLRAPLTRSSTGARDPLYAGAHSRATDHDRREDLCCRPH